MKSCLIEFQRYGSLDTGLLRKGDRYLVTAADRPVREYAMDIDHLPFLRAMQSLRCPAVSATPTDQALRQMSDLVTRALADAVAALPTQAEPLELNLVVNAAEVAALPFELVQYADGKPVLGQRDRPVELVRRIREDALPEIAAQWPAKPRVLFAWAEPFQCGGTVPHEDHDAVLRQALDPWISSDTDTDAADVLTVIEKASTKAIQESCQTSVTEGRPFTHVHILAHGVPVGKGWDQRFGAAFHDADSEDMMDVVPPERLSDALAPLRGQPVVVTLATCDSANATNPITPERSIAHELHASGLPVVIASQLPLNKAGSTVLVRSFYNSVFSGVNILMALHDARCALRDCAEAGHDWASVTAYVRLPDAYAEALLDASLAQVLESMKAIQKRSDALLARATCAGDLAGCERLIALLEDRRSRLESFVANPAYQKRPELRDENLGLLGSAEKRIAELRFRTGADPALVRAGLEHACAWYRRAYRGNIANHWTGTQFLSLQAALTGHIAEPDYWRACLLAAQLDAEKPEDLWALGSLAELYLLSPAAGLGLRLDDAVNAIEEKKRRVGQDGTKLDTTRRQLRRYVDWWTAANGYFPGSPDLAEPARQLLAHL